MILNKDAKDTLWVKDSSSANCDGKTGYPQAKEWSWTLTSNIKITQNQLKTYTHKTENYKTPRRKLMGKASWHSICQ